MKNTNFKKIYANGRMIQSDAGRPKKWVIKNPASVIFLYERFGVGKKSDYEKAKLEINSNK